MGKEKKHSSGLKKVIILSIIFVIVIVFIFFGAKILLYFNLLLGNDTVIKLSADKEFFNLYRGEEANVNFEATAITNPFCTASCNFVFKDINTGNEIEKGAFILRTGTPLEKGYNINASKLGKGQELYRFDIECLSESTWLCHTSESVTTRSVLIVVNYDLNEEDKLLKEKARIDINNTLVRLSDLEKRRLGLEGAYNKLDEKVNNNFKQDFDILRGEAANYKKKMLDIESLWGKQNYYSLNDEINSLNLDITENTIKKINGSLIGNASVYNSLIDILVEDRIRLENLTKLSLDNNTTTKVDDVINDFNSNLEKFQEKNDLDRKYRIVTNTSGKIDSIYLIVQNASIISNSSLNYNKINEVNIEKIIVDESIKVNLDFTFEEPQPLCCVFNECRDCCVEGSCRTDNETYPIIFLHGHAVSEGTSAEYSLEGFNDIQNKLEKDGYLNAGTITLYTTKDIPEGTWGWCGVPITVRGSYYFDVFKEPDNYVVVQTKSENIDTYSIRMRDLVETVKYRTGKDKVNIVAFSMGGLVARRYVQIFGGDSVNKMILIGTPNKGIVGEIKNTCTLTGGELECRDMDKDSLFMNKLNDGPLPNIPIYTIVGSGCKMTGGKDGDGAVLVENSVLEGAQNHIVNGTCRSRFEPLHLDLRNIYMYPEVYTSLLKALKE